MQFKKVQTKTRTRPTYHSICQPRRGGSRPRPTYNAKPINHWSIPDQETSQNTDTTATLNTVVTPTINSDPDTTTTLDTTVTPTVNSDPNTTTTTTLDTTVTPTISSDPNTETNLETTVTPTINSDPNTETTLDTTITPTITSDPTTTTTLDTTVTPTVTNTTETNPTTTQTTNQNPSQMTSQEGQTQEQTEEQNQTQSQTAGDQLQAQGFQLIEGHTNDSPLNNSQTISTTVSGVTVNVNVECGCNEKKHHKEEREECNECDCCTKSFARLLQLVQTEQASIPLPIDSQISIYTNTPLSIGNPIPNQILTNVNDCVSVTFKNAGQATPVPNTTLQIKKVAGISAVNDTTTTDDIFDFYLVLQTIVVNSKLKIKIVIVMTFAIVNENPVVLQRFARNSKRLRHLGCKSIC